MSLFTTLIIGLITGTAIWQFGRRKQADSGRESAPEVDVLEPHMAGVPVGVVAAGDGSFRVAQVSNVQTMVSDDLTVIRGIGPVYAHRLNMAGIQSIAQLAELAPEQISEIVVQENIDKRINSQDWISQARSLVDAASTV